MSSREEGGEHKHGGDLVVSGSIAALRDLAEPVPPLTDLQRKIITWYNQLATELAGPRSGDERGPAQPPSWVKQGPRIDRVEEKGDKGPAFLIEGSGFATTFDVLIDDQSVRGWQVLSHGRLLVPRPPEVRFPIEIVVRTREGDVLAAPAAFE
jgi:hypothetical protein